MKKNHPTKISEFYTEFGFAVWFKVQERVPFQSFHHRWRADDARTFVINGLRWRASSDAQPRDIDAIDQRALVTVTISHQMLCHDALLSAVASHWELPGLLRPGETLDIDLSLPTVSAPLALFVHFLAVRQRNTLY